MDAYANTTAPIDENRAVSDVGQIEEPAYALGNPTTCHSAHRGDEGLENLFIRKLRKDGEVRCVAARAAVRSGFADNIEVALGASPVTVAIVRLNPSALPTTRSLLPLDVGLPFAVFLDLYRALHHTGRARAMRSAKRMNTAKKVGDDRMNKQLIRIVVQLGTQNYLLQTSPDRTDSQDTAYSKENTRITHLGCNLAKNKVTLAEFEDSLAVVRGELLDEEGEDAPV